MIKMVCKECKLWYLCCAIETEGTITVSVTKLKKDMTKDRMSITPRIFVVNKNIEWLLFLKEQFDGYLFQGHNVYNLQWSGIRSCMFILNNIVSGLIIKKEQGKRLLAFCESRSNRRGKSFSRNELEDAKAVLVANKSPRIKQLTYIEERLAKTRK